ncbi:BOLA class I histocompatibility antigen, alpha chain BL3-6-like [Trichomycterus rosablanca]|uniref:BOLA class I histocompatibility antigen, alpha chain BL3-6-like n=1 Tax=Trichomycterus rosablanca TaxID=2290929 RepID=UPI002F35CEEB
MKNGSIVMKLLVLLMFSLHRSSAGTHSYQYIITGVRGIDFPEYTEVGIVDGEQINYYDSNIRRTIPKADWMKKVDYPDYWNINTLNSQANQERFEVDLPIIMRFFNRTEGVHTWQEMYGCELDDDGTVRGHMQYGYNGEDFLSFDLNTITWTAANAKAVIIKNKWDPNVGYYKLKEHYLKIDCVEWIKKYLSYSRETLEREVPAEVFVFHKHFPSPEVVCHATSFYPRGLLMFWQKDGEEVHEDVEIRETLPNQDGSFQKRAILRVSPEELKEHGYTCVVQHISLEKETVQTVPGEQVRKVIKNRKKNKRK